MKFITRVSLVIMAIAASTFAQQYDPNLFSGMKWRLVGPHRAGRVTAVAGIPGNAAVYYFGTPGGGLWKTTDGGRTWKPISDDMHTPSIGAVAVARSNPNIVYVGTGEQLIGNGVYKSTDAGATWTSAGLTETRHISSLIIDPRNPNIVLVGAYDSSPGSQRGVFKTIDGGKNWRRVYFKDDNTGVMDMAAAPDDARVIFAATTSFRLVGARMVPAESHIVKTSDGGLTWKEVDTGLPANPRGRIGVAIAPGTRGQRVYAIMSQGFFRSDDGGASWQQSTKDPRVVGSGYFSRTYVDPNNREIVYVMQTATYRSTDGGRTFAAWKGEPSGEDDHVLWIDPTNAQRIFMGTDQGAVITLNGGGTWTEWFNQPTGEMYHVTSDNQFPYRMYAAQQDSGSVAVVSRSDFGMITYRDWFSTGAFESGHIAPDSANPNVIYSIGWYGSVLRLDRATGQLATVFAPGAKYRYTWETPLAFSPRDPKTLYVGMQMMLKTTDGAKTWKEISPDLTEKAPSQNPAGVITTFAASVIDSGEIWVGTNTGLVQMTRNDGKSWSNVTPSEMPANSNIISIEASPRDADIAYVISAARNDLHPYIFRTRDGGQTWQKMVSGLPDNAIARVVREDQQRKDLLYGGTEKGAYVSFDGGENWQSLQLNLPTVSVRDLHVHGDDLIAATYGRALWILDDISPLRQIDSVANVANAQLFKPATATRTRWDNHPDTPVPPDTPHGDNRPDGAIVYYYLSSTPKEISLEVRDAKGNVVRRFTDKASPRDPRPKNVPEWWFEPLDALSTKHGLNRFVWNLQWPHPDALAFSFRGAPLDYIEYTLPDHAVAGNTPINQPPGPFVVPGQYEVLLTVDGKTYRQPLTVTLDPRVRVSQSDLDAQLELARQMDEWMNITYQSYNDIAALRAGLATAIKSLGANKAAADAASALDKELEQIQNGTSAAPGFGAINRDVSRYVTMIQSGDMRPAESALENTKSACSALRNDLINLRRISSEKLPALNQTLEQFKLRTLSAPAVANELTCPN
ncbi:MAG TPA: YCF48-related protein [Pyrinomonadaceae bacterium]|nr:YCF48-related protein [Pyrinomonadaceae bacterium]